MAIYGWDCSDFDWSRGPVSLQDAYNDGIRLFTHKATEGTRVRHTRIGEAMRRARATGIPYLGAYLVPRTPGNGGNGTVAAQVAYLLDHVDAQVPWWRDHPGWFWQVDLEHWSNAGGVYDAVAPRHGVEACERLCATGRPCLLYAPRWAYGDSIGGEAPLWASDYGSNPAVHYRRAYPGDASPRWAAYSGRTPLILQYGSRTRIGSQPGCDANAIRDESTFTALFTGGAMAARNFGFTGLDQYSLEEKVNLLLLNYCPETPNFNGLSEAVLTLLHSSAPAILDEVRAARSAAERARDLAGQAANTDDIVARVVEQLGAKLSDQLARSIPTAEQIAAEVVARLGGVVPPSPAPDPTPTTPPTPGPAAPGAVDTGQAGAPQPG